MVTAFNALALGSGLTERKFTIGFADTTTANSTHTQTLFTLGARDKILGVEIKHSTGFSGGSLTTCTVSVGVSGAVATFASAFDIFSTAAATNLQETAQFKSGSRAAQSVIATFVGSHIMSGATAGAVEIALLIADTSTP